MLICVEEMKGGMYAWKTVTKKGGREEGWVIRMTRYKERGRVG